MNDVFFSILVEILKHLGIDVEYFLVYSIFSDVSSR